MLRSGAYAQMMHISCRGAHSAYMMRGYVFCACYAQMRIMRRDACALLRIMPYAVMRIISVRTFAYYAHMRMSFVDAHNMHICSYYAHIIR